MRPSDSPAASTRLRSSLGRALPLGAQAQRTAAVGFGGSPGGFPLGPQSDSRSSLSSCSRGGARCRRVRWPFRRFPDGPQSDAHSPRLRLPPTTRACRGLPGYRAVLFGRAAGRTPRRSPLGSPTRLRGCCFPGTRTLEHPEFCSFRGCIPAAHPLACLRFNRPLTADGCKTGYQPAGYTLAGWGSHPQDDSSRFWSTS